MPFDLPHPALLTVWLLWLLQAAWACQNIRRFQKRAGRFQRRRKRELRREKFEPRALVIVPVKGASPELEHHVRAMARQPYPNYRLVFVVESEDDPAYPILLRCAADSPHPITVVTAGGAERCGQKVHNQLRALQELRDDDEAIVFADADAVPNDQWLTLLLHPLAGERVGASTGYRWLVPTPPVNRASTFASVLNASVATLLGRPYRNHAWGGSMALMRKTMDDCKLTDHWRGALSDDYQLTRCVSDAGLRIEFVPWCVVASPMRHSWGSLWEFARRQYTITRVHAPLLWLAAAMICLLYTAGWVAAIAACVTGLQGFAWGLVGWCLVAVLDFIRATRRCDAVRLILGEETADRYRPVWGVERWLTPIWMGLHAVIVLSTAWTRRIRWAGTEYELRGPQDVRIVSRF